MFPPGLRLLAAWDTDAWVVRKADQIELVGSSP